MNPLDRDAEPLSAEEVQAWSNLARRRRGGVHVQWVVIDRMMTTVRAAEAERERLEDALREIAGLSPAAWPTGLRPILYRALDGEA